jgi:hypothetical protein
VGSVSSAVISCRGFWLSGKRNWWRNSCAFDGRPLPAVAAERGLGSEAGSMSCCAFCTRFDRNMVAAVRGYGLEHGEAAASLSRVMGGVDAASALVWYSAVWSRSVYVESLPKLIVSLSSCSHMLQAMSRPNAGQLLARQLPRPETRRDGSPGWRSSCRNRGGDVFINAPKLSINIHDHHNPSWLSAPW